jgi:hypothetical protein
MELREALTQISEIRFQMARSAVFRGYRSVPVALSGLLALAAAGFQAVWLPDPGKDVSAYLTLWVGTAVLSVSAATAVMVQRWRHSGAAWADEVTWLAVEQFLPCLVAGALVTVVVTRFARESLWMLPGLWQVLFSLGIFASYRLLPRATFAVGLFYLVAGLLCLALARGEAALAPWAMGVPFGAGQLLAAAVLYWTLERSHGEP